MGRRRKPKPTWNIACPYCGRPCEFTTGAAIYPHRPDLHKGKYYRCAPCGAYVGAHRGNDKPLGLPANRELRRARIDAHAAFDPLWMAGSMHRAGAYDWLAKTLGISRKDAHIAHFNLDQCARLVAAVAAMKADVPAVYRYDGPDRRVENAEHQP